MNINNFKNHINTTILQRGYDYYENGNIVKSFHQGDDQYIFHVQGSNDYEVIVQLNESGEILFSECDCPYDFDSICKHQVAAYFELHELFNSESNHSKPQKTKTKQPQLKDVLYDLSYEELVDLIVDLTEKNPDLENSIIFRYAKGNDSQEELKKCKKFIHSIIRKYTGREGFIPYRQTFDFAREMEELLEKVKVTNDELLALDIAFLVLNKAIESFQFADDSGGEIGYLVTEIIELIGEIAVNSTGLDINLREKMFAKIMEQSSSEIFDGWEGYKIALLKISAQFADIEGLRNELRTRIEWMLKDYSQDEYKKYYEEDLLYILYMLIKDYSSKEEAERFIKDHLHITFFRELLIDKSMKQKNYHRVIELALEGEKIDAHYAARLTQWKKIRYAAYKKLSMKEEQQELAKELLFDGDFDYYRELKELVNGDHESFYVGLKEELKRDMSWHRKSVYLKLVVEENDLDEILTFVRENPYYIEQYAEMLSGKFREEVIEIYSKYIKLEASNSSNRKEYRKVCAIIKRYKKIAGNSNLQKIISELKTLYKNRPAFLDELSKIK